MKYLEKICCFFIFARIFLHMCPDEKYEKYLSALIEWIAFCLFLLPFISGEVFSGNWQRWENKWQEQMNSSFEETVGEFEEKGEEAARELAEEAVEEVEKERNEEAVKRMSNGNGEE